MDAVFGESATTRDVYDRCFRGVVAGAAEGLSGAILAYGQTSSGKTFSISGSSARGQNTADDPGGAGGYRGILHYALEDLFEQLAAKSDSHTQFRVRVSYCELYMERVGDLLREASPAIGPASPGTAPHLQVKEDAETRTFFVEGLREVSVLSPAEVFALLVQAERRRRVARTRYNDVSSRSHALLVVVVEQMTTLSAHGGNPVDGSDDCVQLTRIGRLTIVDLAGNERVEAGAAYAAESNSINKSLFFLGKVIERLASCEQRRLDRGGQEMVPEYLPVRDSNLTRLLAAHFSGGSRTGLLVTLAPANDSVEESLTTLRFAQKAAFIRCAAQPVFASPQQAFIARQQETIALLQEELRGLRDQMPRLAVGFPQYAVPPQLQNRLLPPMTQPQEQSQRWFPQPSPEAVAEAAELVGEPQVFVGPTSRVVLRRWAQQVAGGHGARHQLVCRPAFAGERRHLQTLRWL